MSTEPTLPPPPPGERARLNEKAVFGLVLGLLMWPLGSPVGIFLGHRALRDIRASGGRETGRRTALAAIVVGWLGLVGLVVFGVYLVLSLRAWARNP
jgi:hypothetical protein